MLEQYPGYYQDRWGREEILIENNGHELQIWIREVEFRGTDFDSLEPQADPQVLALKQLGLYIGCLCSYTLDWTMPIPVIQGAEETPALLQVHLTPGDPRPPPRGGLDVETLQLTLEVAQQTYQSRGISGWFVDELTDLEQALPMGTHLKVCATCALGGYHPAGFGSFGGLACFRDNKQAFRAVKTKSDLFRVWPTRTEFVQETYVCPQFELASQP
ncbi:MAG: DUF6304 family protein [Chloroflexota bacterium]|nr:DUF6304 family protein [Chloroflexota bacterium]